MNWVPSSSGEPSAENASTRHEKTRNLSEVRGLLLRVAVEAIFLIGAVVGAYFASGVLRAILIILAIALFALAAWTGLMAVLFTVLVGMKRRWSNKR